MDNILTKQKELTQRLDEAARAYYAEDKEIISNFEYDRLYDELQKLELETGVVFDNSPSKKVGYEAVGQLPKEAHAKPQLSLNKTKNRQELSEWLGDRKGLLSWKLDGLTIVLTYDDGKLTKAVTRGNGEVGEVVTGNARVFKNLPLTIDYKDHLVVRGEAVIKYSDFETINRSLPEGESKYKNPRNLCSGSVRQLSNRITAERNVNLYAFSLGEAEGMDFSNSREKQFEFLKNQGFEVVEYRSVVGNTVVEALEYFEEKVKDFDIPSDGLVLLMDDIIYGESLGTTAKFPRDAIAFKWQDELAETVLREVEWSPSRTGLINPVAIFDPVELEGTTVARASIHNISIVRELKLGIGDRIKVYKANMIIPQIDENLTCSNNLPIPDKCPCCGGNTEIRQMVDAETLFCINPVCPAKKIKGFALYVSRDACNMEGLSEATLEKFIDKGFIKEFTDLYHLDRYREEITGMEGFGEKSYNNLQEAIRKSRELHLYNLIYGLGIAGIGLSGGKVLARFFGNNPDRIMNAEEDVLSSIEGIGPVLAGQIRKYFDNDENRQLLERILQEVSLIQEKEIEKDSKISGKAFVVTGTLENYSSRDELKKLIESLGGKVTGSVTSKTEALINNDINSNSSKNKKAKSINIPIISEREFQERYLQ